MNRLQFGARLLRTLPVAALLWSMAPGRSPAQDQGIYADFTTSMGAFTCQLDYTHAPMAVANFIGLATGDRAWIDGVSGGIRTNAYFNGLTFHRVIAGFMIQSGSPNGQGTDNPGYVLPDEFDPAVRHDGPGVLSMANSGPNSSGSQFFVTVAATPWLDDVHTIFGRVVSGQAVVNAINAVPTVDNKPVTPVFIESVVIRRVGSEADAFDIGNQNLPVVMGVPLSIARSAGQIELTYANQSYCAHRLRTSSDLSAWSVTDLGIESDTAMPGFLQDPGDAPARFFALTRVQYASSTWAPRDLEGRTLTLQFSGGIGVISIMFDEQGGGTYAYPPGPPGIVTSYTWRQEPYRGLLWPIFFSGIVPMTLRLDFASDTEGRFQGTAYTSGPTDVSGNFTLSP